MIDNSILDKIFSEPDRDTLKDELVAKLQERGFVITNFRSGGIFYTMLMIVVQVRVELTKLLTGRGQSFCGRCLIPCTSDTQMANGWGCWRRIFPKRGKLQ